MYASQVDKKRSLESAEAESENPVCRRRRSGEGDQFFSNFLCKVQTHYYFQIFLESFVELLQICALMT